MIDPFSETWRRVRKHAQDEIATAALALEQQGTGQLTTEFHRGRIAALRALIAIGEPSDPKRKVEVSTGDIQY